jgi:uncharacterized protein
LAEAIAADVLGAIEAHACAACTGHDTAHDALHLRRVVANGAWIVAGERARGQTCDSSVVVAACWLHDLVQLPKGEGPPGEAARRSAAAAEVLLRDLGIAEVSRARVAHAIEAHSFSGRLRPETLEAAIVQDADRLDALGAVGIARLWVTGAMLGGRLYHDTDPAAARRELDDRSFGLDHIERKLLRLPDGMNTCTAREEAGRRAAFVAAYRAEFLRELAGQGAEGRT